MTKEREKKKWHKEGEKQARFHRKFGTSALLTEDSREKISQAFPVGPQGEPYIYHKHAPIFNLCVPAK